MNEQQRQAFEKWYEDTYSYHPCWGITEYTFKEEQERWCVWLAALAQREPVGDGEVDRMISWLHEATFVTKADRLDLASLLSRTGAAWLAAAQRLAEVETELEQAKEKLYVFVPQ